jgi:hypothetical protein
MSHPHFITKTGNRAHVLIASSLHKTGWVSAPGQIAQRTVTRLIQRQAQPTDEEHILHVRLVEIQGRHMVEVTRVPALIACEGNSSPVGQPIPTVPRDAPGVSR